MHFSYKNVLAKKQSYSKSSNSKRRPMSDMQIGDLLPDADRLTKVRRLLRSLSIDEFPQLINVLKGGVTLIDPRPLLVQCLPLYSPEKARRHEVHPGFSGWAQCHQLGGKV